MLPRGIPLWPLPFPAQMGFLSFSLAQLGETDKRILLIFVNCGLVKACEAVLRLRDVWLIWIILKVTNINKQTNKNMFDIVFFFLWAESSQSATAKNDPKTVFTNKPLGFFSIHCTEGTWVFFLLHLYLFIMYNLTLPHLRASDPQLLTQKWSELE